MADEIVVTPPASEPAPAAPAQPDITQFAENIWNDKPAAPAAPAAEPAPAAPVTEPVKQPDNIVDANEWLKQNYGWDNAEAGKQELERLRKLQEQAQTPAEIKFANDQSKQYFDAITNGKTDELYNIMHQQRQLDRLGKLELSSAKEASEIIKANLQFKHKDLQPHEIERIFNRQYTLPEKPKQGLDQEDADYAIVLEQWKAQVAEKEQDMIIDAKLAKPELSKYKSELVLPDIPQPQTQQQGPTQEELAAFAKYKSGVYETINAEFKNFNGFEVVYKDKEVEIPINYSLDDNEKSALKESVISEVLGEHFNVNDFFGNRWFDKEGKPNVQLIMADRYLMENRDKIFQKIANEAGNKRLEHLIKAQSKITVNGNQGQSTFEPNTREKLMEELATVAFQ